MRLKRKHEMALVLSVLLVGGSALGQTAPSTASSSSDPPQSSTLFGTTVPFASPATPECVSTGECVPQEGWNCCSPCLGYGRYWVNVEGLLWWMKGERLPPLVTTSPAGTPLYQAGVLGANNTTVLFGNSTINNNVQGGFQINTGYWLDQNRRFGIQGNFFMLSSQNTTFKAASDGDPILARPFVNALTNRNISELMAYPGLLKGSVSANALTTGLIGAGAMFRATFAVTAAIASTGWAAIAT